MSPRGAHLHHLRRPFVWILCCLTARSLGAASDVRELEEAWLVDADGSLNGGASVKRHHHRRLHRPSQSRHALEKSGDVGESSHAAFSNRHHEPLQSQDASLHHHLHYRQGRHDLEKSSEVEEASSQGADRNLDWHRDMDQNLDLNLDRDQHQSLNLNQNLDRDQYQGRNLDQHENLDRDYSLSESLELGANAVRLGTQVPESGWESLRSRGSSRSSSRRASESDEGEDDGNDDDRHHHHHRQPSHYYHQGFVGVGDPFEGSTTKHEEGSEEGIQDREEGLSAPADYFPTLLRPPKGLKNSLPHKLDDLEEDGDNGEMQMVLEEAARVRSNDDKDDHDHDQSDDGQEMEVGEDGGEEMEEAEPTREDAKARLAENRQTRASLKKQRSSFEAIAAAPRPATVDRPDKSLQTSGQSVQTVHRPDKSLQILGQSAQTAHRQHPQKSHRHLELPQSWPLLMSRGDAFLQHRLYREDDNWFQSTCSSALSFYGYLFCCAGVLFMIVKGLEALKVVTPRQFVSEAMLRVAVYYTKWPRGAPIVATGALFAGADVVAQLSKDYWSASPGTSFWSVTTTLSVGATAALLHGGLVTHYYMRFEATAAPARDITSGIFKVGRLLGYYLAWLTVYALLFGLLAGLLCRIFWDATTNCAFSVVLGLPFHAKESATYQVSNYVRTFTSSCIFWTPSHAANYWVSQRWSPNFRTTWDGGMALLWNLHVLRGSGGLMAVGPVLSGLAPSTGEVLPSVDCSRWSLWACTAKIWDVLLRIWGWIRWLLGKVWNLLCNIFSFTKSTLWWLWTRSSYLVRTILYWAWYLVLWIFTILRLVLWLALMIVWQALRLIFGILDTVKRMMFMGWIPDFFPYRSCPYCFIYPGDGSWPGTMAGNTPVMYDGS